MKKYLLEIIFLLGSDKRKLPYIVLSFLILSTLDLAGVALIGPFIGVVTDANFTDSFIIRLNTWNVFFLDKDNIIPYMSLLLVLTFFLKSLSGLVIHYIISKFSVSQQTRLRVLLIKSYQQLPYTKYLDRNSSEYIHSVQLLVNHYTKGIIFNLMKMFSEGVVAILIILFLMYSSTKETVLLICVLLPFIYFYDKLFKTKVQAYGRIANDSSSKIIQGIHESVQGLKEVRILGCEEYFVDKVKGSSEIYGNAHIKSSIIGSIPKYFIEFLMVVFVVLMVYLISSVDQSNVSISTTLVTFGVAAVRLTPITSTFLKGFSTLRLYRDSVSRLYLDIRGIGNNNNNNNNKNNISSKLDRFETMSLNKVSYSYDLLKQKNVINNLNMTISKGQAIGIIGSSGSGKTTLIDLILGLLNPSSGNIFLNGCNINKDYGRLQKFTAYIPQDIFLIDDTLKANIALGVPLSDVDNVKLNRAISMSKVDEFIGRMPLGINTIVGESGIRLSGGQKQRIALARAFYYDREVLVFDEATSALDNKIEAEIIKEINDLRGSKTLIIIAHRLSTIKSCDYIYKLDRGQVVSQGKPENVI